MIGTGIFYHIIVIVSVRRAEQEHVIAGQLFDLVVYGHEFLRLLLIAELCHIFVVFAVVAQIMSCLVNLFYIIRITGNPTAGHEKGGLYLVFGQDIQKSGCILIAPGSIKTDGYLGLVSLYTVYGELTASHCAADRDDTGQICDGTEDEGTAEEQCYGCVEKFL